MPLAVKKFCRYFGVIGIYPFYNYPLYQKYWLDGLFLLTFLL